MMTTITALHMTHVPVSTSYDSHVCDIFRYTFYVTETNHANLQSTLQAHVKIIQTHFLHLKNHLQVIIFHFQPLKTVPLKAL